MAARYHSVTNEEGKHYYDDGTAPASSVAEAEARTAAKIKAKNSSSSSTQEPELLQNATIQGQVYDNVTREEILNNKLSINTKAVLDTSRTQTRDEVVLKDQERTAVRETQKTINQKVVEGKTLTADEQYFLLTGKTEANIENTNEFLQRTASSRSNTQQSKENIENLYNYNEKAQEYQKNKNKSTASKSPLVETKKYSENWGIRTSQKWAERLVKQETKVAKDRQDIRDYYKLGGLDIQKTDNAAVKTFKALGNIASAWTFEIGSTTEAIFLTGEKAAFYAFTGGTTISNKEQRAKFKESSKEQAKGALESISPIKKENGSFVYNPEGTANILFASAIANVQTGLKTRDPRLKTTGKVESKDIQVKGQIEVKGTTKGTPSTTGSKQTLSLKFQEKTKGIFGKKVETTIERTPRGTIIKTQEINPNTYVRTIQVKGSKNIIIEKVVGGKLTKTYVTKGTGLQSEFTQYENIIKARTKAAYQPTDDVIVQSGYTQSFQNIEGQVSKTQLAKGPLKVTTTAESYSQAGIGSRLTARTSKQGLSLTEFEVTQGKLALSKAPPKPALTSENIKSAVTLTRKPIVNTAYNIRTDITGKLKVSDLPSRTSLFESKTASFGQDPSLLKETTFINEISTPNLDASFTLPRLAVSEGASPTIIPPIDLSKFATERETGTFIETEINNDNLTEPTLRLGKLNDFNIKQNQKPKEENILTLGKSNILRQGNTTIQETKQVQQPQFKEFEPLQELNTKQNLVLNFNFDTPKVDLPIPFLKAPFSPPNVKNKPIESGFNVFTKKGGKDILITAQPLSEKSALAFGSLIVGSSARASFRLEKAKGPLGSFTGESLLGDFYKSKSGAFVEKREKRINTLGELKEITFSPKNTRKKKAKKKTKANFSIKGGLF